MMGMIYTTIGIDPIAGVMLLWMMLSEKNGLKGAVAVLTILNKSHWWCLYFRVCLSTTAAGLILQCYRSFVSACCGIDMLDKVMPWWALKDIGVCMAVFGAFYALKIRNRRKKTS